MGYKTRITTGIFHGKIILQFFLDNQEIEPVYYIKGYTCHKSEQDMEFSECLKLSMLQMSDAIYIFIIYL